MRLMFIGMGLWLGACSSNMRPLSDDPCNASSSGSLADPSACDGVRAADTNIETNTNADAGAIGIATADATTFSDAGSRGVAPLDCPSQATSLIAIAANLDARATPPSIECSDAKSSWESCSNFLTIIRVYDWLGEPHDVEVFFANRAPGAWCYYVVVNDEFVVGNGDLTFTAGGALQRVEVIQPIALPSRDGTTTTIQVDFGPPIDRGGTGFDGLTCFPVNSNVTYQSQNRNPGGSPGSSCSYANDTLPGG